MMLASIFSTDGFPQRWQCGIWSDAHGWTHIISDIAIWLAYTSIPFAIYYYARKRPEFGNKKLIYLFVAFIALCGFTHLVEALIFWWPAYRFLGLLKFLTAVVSVATVIVLLYQMPRLLKAPLSADLEREIEMREVMEKQLLASEKMFRSAMTYAPIGKALVSTDGKWIKVNKKLCELLGYDEEGLLKTDFQHLTHQDDLEKDLLLVESALRGEIDSYTMEKRYIRKDGELLYARLSVVLMRDSDGNPDFFISQIQDLTNETKLYQLQESLIHELEQKSRDMQQIVYVSSHDLRSPLVNIIGFSSELEQTTEDLAKLLKEKDGLPDRVHKILSDDIPEMVHFISDSGRRMDRLLKGLLQYSRLGRYSVESQEIDMDKLIAELVQDLSFQLKEIDAEVTVEPLPMCYCDLILSGQIFRNLLSNTIKYREPTRPLQLKISAQSYQSYCCYTIEDNGVGINENHHKRIFEVFHRLNPDASEGDGLGLSICSLLAQRMQGRIWLDSQPGVGSKFHVELPRSYESNRYAAIRSDNFSHSYLSDA